MSSLRNLILLILLGALATLTAAPLRFTPIRATQPDGREIEIFASGDEFHNWLHDADNYTIVRDERGAYVYAAQDGERVMPTSLLVGRDKPTQRGLQPGINLGESLVREKYDRYAGMRDYSDAKSPHTGQFNNLVIYIKFSDDTEFTTPLSAYDDMFNNPDGNSMKRYFWEASYNQLMVNSTFYPTPNGDVIVSYTDTYPRAYFRPYSAANPQGYSGDNDRTQREHQLLLRAVTAVGPQVPESLVIDGDNDNYVDNTCFIIKGSPDGWAELLWPHRWVLYTVNAMIHGKRVWDFNFQIETSTLGSGASVLSHEMFHSLGAPDLYRYTDTTIDPIGNWDLMCANANPPQHTSVWMKHKYGQWVGDVPDITESGTYTLSPVASSSTNNIYRIAGWRTNEYYILEYRRPSVNYDHNLPGQGLLVYRLNTQLNGNAQGPPDELYLYRPYGYNATTNGAIGMASFSAQSGRTELSEATSPNGFMSNNAPGGLNLYDVGEAGETITFKVKVSQIQLTYPHGGETWFSGTNKSITWKAKTLSGTVTLEYSVNGGGSWITLNTSAANNGSYYWTDIPSLNSSQVHIRVTQNSNGQIDSNVYPFTIVSEMAIPEPSYPADGANNVPTNPILSWSPVAGVTGYQLQVSDSEDFSSFVVNELNYQGNNYPLYGLTPYHTYYWRICSISEIGIGPFCEVRHFTTGNLTELPNPPNLTYPNHLAAGLPTVINFVWTVQPLASFYDLEVSHTPYFVNYFYHAVGIDMNQYTVSTLAPGTTYYWRVRAGNVAGYSSYSLIRRFTTAQNVEGDDPTAPVLVNELAQNHPNPFNPSTTIQLSVKDSSLPLSVEIYDLRGRLVRRLYSGLPSGNRLSLVWDGRDDSGQAVASGIYHYRMRSGSFSETRKMIMMK